MDPGHQHKTRYTECNRSKVGKALERIGTAQNFLNRTPVTQALRSTVDKGDLLKMKSFSKVKDTDTRTKQQATN